LKLTTRDCVVIYVKAMLNLREGHVFVELNYPHFMGISGYELHHDMATRPGIFTGTRQGSTE